MKFKALSFALLLSSAPLVASSSPFGLEVIDSKGAKTLIDINDITVMKNILQMLGNGEDLTKEDVAKMAPDMVEKFNELNDGVFDGDVTASVKVYGSDVLIIAKKDKKGTIKASDFGIDETFDLTKEGVANLGAEMKKKFDKTTAADFVSNLYSGLLTTFQKSPVSPLSGNPVSALSTMISLTSSMALAAKGTTTGWVTPSINGSALSLNASDQEKSGYQSFNTISLSGQYTQLSDGDISFKSYTIPLAYMMSVSWVPGMKWVLDAAYRYSTVDNPVLPTKMHVASLGTGFSIPFGKLTLMPHIAASVGASMEIGNVGLLWDASLSATYDIAMGPGTLTLLGLGGYGASFAIDLSKYVDSEDAKGLVLDPKISSPHIKAGVNYVFPINDNLFIEAMASHTQFFEGSKMYVSRVEEAGLNFGLMSSKDSPLGAKVGASYLYSEHHKGFMINLNVTF